MSFSWGKFQSSFKVQLKPYILQLVHQAEISSFFHGSYHVPFLSPIICYILWLWISVFLLDSKLQRAENFLIHFCKMFFLETTENEHFNKILGKWPKTCNGQTQWRLFSFISFELLRYLNCSCHSPFNLFIPLILEAPLCPDVWFFHRFLHWLLYYSVIFRALILNPSLFLLHALPRKLPILSQRFNY